MKKIRGIKMSQDIHPFNDKATAILKYEPIELNGLVYYPLKVADYEKWQAIKPVLTLRQGTLPAVYACMTFLQCAWALQYDALKQGNTKSNLWDILACLMFLSLRLSDGDMIQPIGNSEDPRTVSAMRIVKNGEQFDIGPMEFAQVRKLIADQNGAELPDEADNPDLIEAAEDIMSQCDIHVKADLGDMLTSVSSVRNIRRADVMEWPIKEFDDELRAINRRFGFFLASIAQAQGAKFPKGNPYPTWIFEKSKDEFAGLISMEKLSSDHHASFIQSDSPPPKNITI